MPLTPPRVLAPLLAQPVAVFGAGVSGDGVRALLGLVGAGARVFDARGDEFTDAAAKDTRLVVYSPGFVPDHPWLRRARAAGVECLGELDFASLFWRGKVVAITGTNGKTTLTELITHALRSAGEDAHATGNIGHSFSQLAAELRGGAPTTTAVCEVSSFQAETLKHLRPDAVLWTNFAEDHLERHPGLAAYFAAKWRLVERVRDGEAPASRAHLVFLGSSVRRYALEARQPLDGVRCVDTEGQPPDARLAGTAFAEYPQRENFLLAKAWWLAGDRPEAALYAAARTFKLGRHRLTRVAEIRGVTYWNDSKATNFHAVETALTQFRTPVVLIAGGKAKGGELGGFVARIAPRVQHVVLIGATAAELARHCDAAGVACSRSASLADAVTRAATIAPAGAHVLLSPGFASFDQFRSYEDRGEQFEQLVRELAAAAVESTGGSATQLR